MSYSHKNNITIQQQQLERGPELRGGGTKWSRRGSLCKVRQDAGVKLAAQQLSGRTHIETRARGCKSLNLRISQEQETKGRCAVSALPLRTPFVTPVLPGPGSDIWKKVMSKTEKSRVWFFQNAGGLWRRCVLPLLTAGLGTEGVVPHSVGGSMWFLVFLFVCVRAGPSYRAAYWRVVLATASGCVEGYRTPDEALVC